MGIRTTLKNIINPIEGIAVSLSTLTDQLKREMIESAAESRKKSKVSFEELKAYINEEKELDKLIASRYD